MDLIIEYFRPYFEQILPGILICLSTLLFLFLERKFPGRELPESKGWYLRAIMINLAQFLLIGLSGITWNKYFRDQSLLHLGSWSYPVVEGFVYWVIGTFVFYWWHRLRHANGFWLIFHQLHHSPKRIELATSFYKHPVEIIADSIIAGFLIYYVLVVRRWPVHGHLFLAQPENTFIIQISVHQSGLGILFKGPNTIPYITS